MNIVYFGTNPVEVYGDLPQVGVDTPEFTLVKSDLSDMALSDFKGKRVVLNIFPSIDTDVCAKSVRRFNELVSSMENTIVLCISKDLPFASSRFCVANGIENVMTLSAFRSDFGEKFGVEITTGPLRGLLARSVIVIDVDGKVKMSMLCENQHQEPDYDGVLNNLK